MNVGDRVRFNEQCPWPGRVGCVGTVVAPPSDGTYPQPTKGEVVLLLDDDPLVDKPNSGYHCGPWSCVADTKSLEVA